jgi:hypothetical protein
VRVLDVRGRHPSSPLPHAKRAECAECAVAHVPGAVFIDWEHAFVDADDPVPVSRVRCVPSGRIRHTWLIAVAGVGPP